MISRLRTQRGYTLIELMVVMSVIGALIVAIWIGAAILNRTRKDTEAAEQVTKVIENIRTLYSARADVTGMSNSYLVSAGAIPQTMQTTNPNNLESPWGQPINIQPAVGGTLLQYEITYSGLFRDSCIKLALAHFEERDDLGIDAIHVNGSQTWPDLGDPTLPLTPAMATTACNNATNANAVRWVLWLRR